MKSPEQDPMPEERETSEDQKPGTNGTGFLAAALRASLLAGYDDEDE